MNSISLYTTSHDSLLKTEINFIFLLFKRNGYPISFILNVIDRFKNKFNNQNRQFTVDSLNNTPSSNPYLTLLYFGSPFIKFGERITPLFRNRLGTDIKIAYQTFKIISYFDLNFLYPLFSARMMSIKIFLVPCLLQLLGMPTLPMQCLLCPCITCSMSIIPVLCRLCMLYCEYYVCTMPTISVVCRL